MSKRSVFWLVFALATVSTGCAERRTGDEVAAEERAISRTVVPPLEITTVGKAVPIDRRKPPVVKTASADGGEFDLADHRGKVVLINFWATWCAPCIVETPLLVDTYAAYRDSGLVVVGVSLDRDGFDAVIPFLERFRVDYPVIMGGTNLARAFGGAYILPTTFFVDREGSIVSRINGQLHKDVLLEELRQYL